MLNKILLILILGLIIAIVILALRIQQYRSEIHYKNMEYDVLHNKYVALEDNYTAYIAAHTKKEEVHHETEQQLADIAASSIDDSIHRLQNRKNNNSN